MPMKTASQAARLSVAPMMEWTDRHCRMLHRSLSRHALLYTEMVAALAVIHGPRERLLGFTPAERPLALQLGGSDPEALAEAVRIAVPYGYDEINLNIGCPSDKVQSGAFGACLMREPDLVARCVSAMLRAGEAEAGADAPEITVKCRIGVDEQEPAEALPAFLDAVSAEGVETFVIHARKAWLKGLSPKENRDVPPLDYPLVHRMKAERPSLRIVLNGGLASLDAALRETEGRLDGAMIGRAAYNDPVAILGAADRRMFGASAPDRTAEDALDVMRPYIAERLAAGDPLHWITRHMLGLFAGRPGARAWRRTLTDLARRPGAGLEVIDAAVEPIRDAA